VDVALAVWQVGGAEQKIDGWKEVLWNRVIQSSHYIITSP